MIWFKHYNTASQGNSLRLLWDEGDYDAYGLYWRLLELVSLWESKEERGKITLSWSILKRELGWNRQRTSKVLSKISKTLKIEVEPICDESFTVFIPNWLELQENRGGKNRAKKSKVVGEERREKKEERRKIPSTARSHVERAQNSGFKFDNFLNQFEVAYASYPKKEGKKRGLDTLRKDIRSEIDVDLFLKAVKNYSHKVVYEKTEAKYIKHFSTFCSKEAWRDYIELEIKNEIQEKRRLVIL